MKRIFSVLLLAVLGAMGPAAANETPEDSEIKKLPDSIVVSANRVGLAGDETVWPTAVVNSTRLENESDLETALDGRAGLDIRSYNGFGSLATLSNWGLFNRHMLLLYNGRVVKDYSMGGFNLADFSADEIERVEILKGPQSAFYGADAVGGVVNLMAASSLVDKVEMSVKEGSLGYQSYDLNLSRKFGQVGMAGQVLVSESDNGRSNAGSERLVLNMRSDYLSSDGRHQIAFSARYFDDSLGVPGPDPGESVIPVYGDEESYSLYDHQMDENYSADFQYRLVDEKLGQFQADVFWEKKNLDYNSLYNYQWESDSVDVNTRSIYNKRSLGVSGRYVKDIRLVQMAGGVDYLSGSIRSTTFELTSATDLSEPPTPNTNTYESYEFWSGGQDQFDVWSNVIVDVVEAAQVDLSGRLQFVKGRRTQPSYNLGFVLSPTAWMKWKAGYAYAFRLPTIAEQFAEDVFTAGNDRLKPETSRSVISTLTTATINKELVSSVTVFYQTVDSLVQYQWDGGIYRYVPRNVNKFKTAGVDFGIEYRLRDKLSLGWSGVVQSAKQTTEANEDFVAAYYVPDVKWRLDVSGEQSRLSWGVNLSYTSDRSIVLNSRTKTIEKVYELGASIGVEITPNIRFSLSGYDLTDEQRPDQFGYSSWDGDYPSPGRRLVIGARFGLF